jgi:hypothetical protein
MNTDFLLQENWPVLGRGQHSEATKMVHEWCGKISEFVLALAKRVEQMENKEKESLSEISKLKSDVESAKTAAKSSNISSCWVQAGAKNARNAKKPVEQLVVANATINELNEREKRKKNVMIYGVAESTKVNLTEKKAEDEKKVQEVLQFIGKADVKPAYLRRLKSRDASKPGPIIVELTDVSLRNPILLAAKKLRSSSEHATVYISPDLTEAERKQDYDLRKERNRLNSELGENSPFRYGIRGSQILKFNKTM